MRKTNLLVYVGGGGSGGYVRYCRGLLSSKPLTESIDAWLICSPSFILQIGQVDNSFRVIRHEWISNPSILKRILWHFVLYPRLVCRLKPNVEFYTSGFLPPLRRLLKGGSKIVTTCHNLLPFCVDVSKSDGVRGEYLEMRRQLRNHVRSLKRSDAIIYLSQYSKGMVSPIINKRHKTTVVAHGIDASLIRSTHRSYEFGDIIKLLYVSTIYPYKHQVEVVSAVQSLRLETKLDIRLNIVGGGPSQSVDNLTAFLVRQNSSSYVTITDFLGKKALAAEYEKADIFVFASDCESFGITLLEAMGQRLPIACSKETGLPDILRDAGVYFDPTDVRSIFRALHELVGNKHTRKHLGEKAYQYSLDYTWGKCAAQTFKYIAGI